MGLVLKTNTVVSPSGEKLYKDVLVSEGTLLLHDYSNRGTLYGYSLTNGYPVRDLAQETSNALGIDNKTKVIYNEEDGSPEITGGLGVPMWAWGTNTGGINKWGMNLGKDLLNYLADNVSNEFVFTFWARRDLSITPPAGAFITSTQLVGGSTVNAVRINMAGNGNITSTFGGGSGANGIDWSNGDLHQVSVHYKGAGQRLDVYVDGEYAQQGGSDAVGFGTGSTDLVVGKIDSSNPAAILYRWFIEDLTVSGRSASEVVSKDYQYNTGTGMFSYMAPRPFIDTL